MSSISMTLPCLAWAICMDAHRCNGRAHLNTRASARPLSVHVMGTGSPVKFCTSMVAEKVEAGRAFGCRHQTALI